MTEDEKAIRQVVETWADATRSHDIATVLTLMTDDVVFTVPGQEPFGKEVFAKSSERMRDVRIDSASEILELKVLGDWAFLRSRIAMTATPPDGAPIRRSGHTLTLFHKEADGRWRLARDANLLAPG